MSSFSFTMALAKRKASEGFFNPTNLKEVADKIINKIDTKFKLYDYPEYNLNIESHKSKTNYHDAIDSVGCGCELCIRRFYYASSKKNVNFFKRSFYDDNYYNYIFEDLYIKEADSYGMGLTRSDYFELRLQEYKNYANSLKPGVKEIIEVYKKLNIPL